MKYRYKITLIIAPLIFILDQLTKWWVREAIPLGDKVPIIPGFFDLVHTMNEGAAFGMFAGTAANFRIPFFYAVAAVAVVVISIMLWKIHDEERLLPVSFALVLGGIAGNILDRIMFGAVVDFLSFHWKDVIWKVELFGWRLRVPLDWPAFNVADAAITVAMFMLIIAAFKRPKEQTT
jgi:signal peptidase II